MKEKLMLGFTLHVFIDDNYVKMKKGYQPNEEVWDVLKSTHWSSSSTVTITSLEDVLWSRDDEYQQAA